MIVQAMSLFKDLTKKHGNESEELVASRGWFSKFKARTNLRNVKVQGEAASADHAAASAFPDGFGSDNLGEGGVIEPTKCTMWGRQEYLGNVCPNIHVL